MVTADKRARITGITGRGRQLPGGTLIESQQAPQTVLRTGQENAARG